MIYGLRIAGQFETMGGVLEKYRIVAARAGDDLGAGEPVCDGNALFGSVVNLTARIESETAGGEILISSSTLEKLRSEVELGRQKQAQVKGIMEPVTMHQVLYQAAKSHA